MKKYKILVLSDLSNDANVILKSTINLAKLINGEIELFTVKNPKDLIEEANPLSAIRTINDEHSLITKKIKNLILPLAKDSKFKINYSSALGNIKNEIENYIEENRPDVIVLGKRKSKPFNFIGNDITQSVLNIFNGTVMIVNDKNAFEPSKEMSLAVLNGLEPSLSFEFAKNLLEQTQQPLKSFSIIKNTSSANEPSILESKKQIEYVFENSDSVVNNLSNYLSKSNIDLLFVKRGKAGVDKHSNYIMPNIKDVIGKLGITLLIAGK